MTGSLTRSQRAALVAAASVSVVVLLLPLPGSLSVSVTWWLTGVWAGVPGVELVSEIALVVLACGVAAMLLRAWIHRTASRLRLIGLTASVVLAYGASELVKVLLVEERPCRRRAIPGDCAAAGDWSFPSNHATLAFAAAAVIALTTRRLSVTLLALACAVVVALGRVAQGAHYLHDTAAGALLGVAVVMAAAAVVGATRRRRESCATVSSSS